MQVFVTGAAGYIGGSIAARLIEAGHGVRGLVRSEAKAEAVRALGITPVEGTLDDGELLAEEARGADAVINAASSDHRGAVDALLAALAGSDKPFLHTSGSSVIGDEARGEPSDRVVRENDDFEPHPARAARYALDRAVLGAGKDGVRSAVLCNTLIYGRGLGAQPDSIQVPYLVRQARASGVARHVGRGLNVWSHVHIEDLADLYVLALAKAEPGSFLFVENGEASFRDMAAKVAQALGCAGPEDWPFPEAAAAWGEAMATFTMGSNSRVRGALGRELGWSPSRPGVLDWIAKANVDAIGEGSGGGH
ncbi:NAD-dependent epimerase/dehydratase family protein [Marinivivus vitaminiproducens]|uniref:NAD-dependent epimerase/dehydratase family protein n=1 Tax=Marinivivus vitaminiproducens TaxID=3035935 RepID=UPI0027AA176A|nr:NAD-dependent epimerase/dehydratase family protein [Geminicoccaceae bacterium SCSIO 64248]